MKIELLKPGRARFVGFHVDSIMDVTSTSYPILEAAARSSPRQLARIGWLGRLPSEPAIYGATDKEGPGASLDLLCRRIRLIRDGQTSFETSTLDATLPFCPFAFSPSEGPRGRMR